MLKYEGNIYDVSVEIGSGDNKRFRTAIIGAATLDDAVRLARLLGNVTGVLLRTYHYILAENPIHE